MSFYWRLKPRNSFFVASEIREAFPELKNLSTQKVENILNDMDIDFYLSDRKKSSILWRLSMPFALVFIAVLFILLPINFMLTGKWGYKILWVRNWFKAIGF